MAGYKGNAAITAYLNLLFINTAWANIGSAAGLQPASAAGFFYLALHTGDPTAANDQTSNETVYTNYARLQAARTNGVWTVSAQQVSNAGTLNFPQGGATGATIQYFSLGVAASGASQLIYGGPLSANLVVSNLITPNFAAGALIISEA